MSIIPADPKGTRVLDAHNTAHAGNYLGEIVWPSLHKTEILQTEVAAVFAAANLGQYAPKLSSPPDVFRRVCRDLLQTTIHHDDDTVTKLINKEIGDNPLEIARRVVCEHLDSAGGRLSYEQTWDLRFTKATGDLQMYPVTVEADGTVRSRDRHANPAVGDEYLEQVKGAIQRALVSIDRDGLARAVTKVLDDAKAVSVRHGGIVYYVPAEHRDMVAGLKYVASKLEGITMNGCAIPNTPDQVAMVAEGISDRTTSEATALIRELRDAKSGQAGPIGSRRVKTLVAEHRNMKSRLKHYKELLHDELSDATTQVEVLSNLMASVLDMPYLLEDDSTAAA